MGKDMKEYPFCGADVKKTRCRAAFVGLLLLFTVFAALSDFSFRTAAQTPLIDDAPVLNGAPVPDDYEFEVLASSHTVIGVRPDPGDDFDIEVYTDTTFTTLIDSSMYSGSAVDFVFLNGTEWASPPNRSARVTSGATNYVIEMENNVSNRGLSSPWNASINSSGGVVEVLDAFELSGAVIGRVYGIHLEVPATADLNLFVMNATGGRSDALAYSANAGPGVNETLSFTAWKTDDIMLVITNEDGGTGNYTITPNDLPNVSVGADVTIDEGDNVEVSGNVTNVDMTEEFTYVWDFGDGYNVSGIINATGNLLENGDFSDGLNGWDIFVDAPATTTLQIIPSDGPYLNVLEINNPINDLDGDWDFAYQDLFLNVTNYTTLYFEADGKAIYQSLSDDGVVGGEYPVHFSIRYQDINGVWHHGLLFNNPWQRGFYYLGTGQYTYSIKVQQNVWFHYKSGNLMDLVPKPRLIERVRVGSSGWAYHGMIDNVELYNLDYANTTILANHTYGDNGVFDVTLTIADSFGCTSSDTLEVTVNNVAPSVDPLLPVSIDEGEAAVFSGHATDPGSDDLTFTWNWDFAGFSDTVNTDLNSPPNPDPFPSTEVNPRDVADGANRIYGDNGVFIVTLNVTDDDGGFNVTTTSVTVNNVVPTADSLQPATIDEGEAAAFSSLTTDPGSDDLTFTWNWGFAGFSDTVNMVLNNPPNPDPFPSAEVNPRDVIDGANRAYGDDGVFIVTLNITDDDGGFDITTTSVTVNNVAPTGDIGGPYSGNVGTPIDFSGSASDQGSDDLIFTWSWDDGSSDTVNTYYNDGAGSDQDPSPAGVYPFSAVDAIQHVFDVNGSYDVTLTITDDDGGSVIYSTTVTVGSYPPVIENVEANPSPQIVGKNVTISASVTDADTDSADLTVTVSITKPDGSFLGNHTMTYDATEDIFWLTLSFDAAGTYGYTVWAVDPEGNSDKSEDQFVMEPESEPESFNWKPIIALIFTIILLIFGYFASWKRPVRFTGILKKDQRNTFLVGVLPFAIAEAVSGIVSALTGHLSIPPFLGLGMVVDLVILGAGLTGSAVIADIGVNPETYKEDTQGVQPPSVLPPPPPPPPPPTS